MNKEKIEISVNEEDVQNIINCYEKDIEYIKQLKQENQKLQQRINEAIGHINSCGCVLSTDKARYLLEILKGEN